MLPRSGGDDANPVRGCGRRNGARNAEPRGARAPARPGAQRAGRRLGAGPRLSARPAQAYDNVTVEEIHGLTLRYFANRLDKSQSLFENLKKAPAGIKKNIQVYTKVAEDGFKPELVISDFESWAAFYALNHFLPVISIDNMQVINRCRHDKDITAAKGFNFNVAKLAVKMKMPGAYHYLVSSFFFPPVKKKRTTLVPPILRPEIIAARREPGDHVLVYQTSSSNETLLPVLQKLPYRFRVYGMGREGSEGNVTLRAFSETGFVDDLRTARAVIAGGGFSLMSEAVSLHVPMLSVPIEQQYEQELNARYLAHLGYGAWASRLDERRDHAASWTASTTSRRRWRSTNATTTHCCSVVSTSSSSAGAAARSAPKC